MMRAILILLVACGPRVLHVLPDPYAYKATEEVAAAVNAAAGRELIVFGPAPGSATTYVSRICGMYERGEIFAASCGQIDRVALTHEFGHAFGLPHSKDPESVMWPYLRGVLTLEEAAASLVKELGQ